MPPTNESSRPKNHLAFSLDMRLLLTVLLVIIIAMLAIWRPWTNTTSDRTITVTGDATQTAKPDEFVFYPAYQFKNASKETALSELTKKSDELVAKLKALGVAEEKIKTNTSGGADDRLYLQEKTSDGTTTYTLQLTVTINDAALAQKVQDYLVTTNPTGAVSPQPNFSETKRKELEGKARDDATTDARKKADQMAKNLGFTIGKVKSISDGASFDIKTLEARGSTDSAAPSLAVQPGEQDLRYSVTVVYFIQ